MDQVLARSLAALAGGYVLAHLLPLAVVVPLPLARPEAVMVAALLSFSVQLLAILWCFGARSARRAWAGMLLAAAACAPVLLALGDRI